MGLLTASSVAALAVLALCAVVYSSSRSPSVLLQGRPSNDFAQKLEEMRELNTRDGEILARKDSAWKEKKEAGQQGLKYMDGYYYNGAPNQQQQQNANIGAVPNLGGTNSVFMGSNGGGLGFARRQQPTQGLRYMDGYYYNGAPNQQQQQKAPQSRNIGAVPNLGGTNSVFMGSNGGGLGFARRQQPTQGLRAMQQQSQKARKTAKLDFLEDEYDHVNQPHFNKLNSVEEHVPVATGNPGTYDGRWGEQYRRNAGGREEAMKRAGVNYDDYPYDVYRSVPFIPFDPAATHQRDINQKVRSPKVMAESYIQTSGRNAGGETWPAGWGLWNGGRAHADRLREGGISVDKWPIDVYNGFPNPAWDKSEYDGKRHVYRPVPETPEEVVERAKASKQALGSAGVNVDGMPWEEKKHAYNTVDGALDRIVPYEKTPKYREKGLAVQEKPLHFLLNDNLNGETHTQKEALENFWTSGAMDQMPQPLEDDEKGIEFEPEVPEEEEGPEEEEPEEEME